MKNTKTNTCLPAASRASGQSSILHSASCTLHSAFCILHSAFVAAALAAAMTAGVASAEITSTGSRLYTAAAGSNEIEFSVGFGYNVTVTPDGENKPYLVLSGVQKADGSTAQAEYDGAVTMDNVTGMHFTYTVQPGDFSAGVGITSLMLNGATITDPAEEEQPIDTDAKAAAAIAEMRSYNAILVGETITIQTMTATVLTAPPYRVGSPIEVQVSIGGAAPAAMTFDVTSSDSAKAKPADGFAEVSISAGSSSATATVNLLVDSSNPVSITFTPQGYPAASAVSASFTINKAAEAAIVAVRPFATETNYTYSAGTIGIEVEFSGAITAVGNRAPELQLVMDPNRKATLIGSISDYVGLSSLYFSYDILAGDATTDLCCEPGVNFPIGLKIDGASLTPNAWSAMPKKGTAGSLSANADIRIETIRLGSNNTRQDTLSGKEGEILSVIVTRKANEDEVPPSNLIFDIIPSQSGKVDCGGSQFTIPKGETEATLQIGLSEAATQPVTLKLHPNGYSTDAGDITLTINIAENTEAKPLSIAPTAPLVEGMDGELKVSLPSVPLKATTITLSCVSGGDRLTLQETTKILNSGETECFFKVLPLDGLETPNDPNSPVRVVVASDNKLYLAVTNSIPISNASPYFVPTPPEDPPEQTGGAGTAIWVSWSGANDVTADKGTLKTEINWGDGSALEEGAAGGSASHVYQHAGEFTVTITIIDKDKGRSSPYRYKIIIEEAISVLINEYKARIPADSGQNAYKSLDGLGRGTVDDDDDTTLRVEVTPLIDWEIKYPPTTTSMRFRATPETFTYRGYDYDGAPGDFQFDSFFHVWLGDEETFASPWALVPLSAPANTLVRFGSSGSTESQHIGGVFAREYYIEDNYADIDHDRLPDRWEELYLSTIPSDDPAAAGAIDAARPYESISGAVGETGNPDGDFFPACVSMIRTAPVWDHGVIIHPVGEIVLATGDQRFHYEANGIPFVNVYEVRGTHFGLNAPDSDPVDPQDEPRMGSYTDDGSFTESDSRKFYGTDPTNADTDNDRLTDGYEYYFWRLASLAHQAAQSDEPIGDDDPGANEQSVGEAYDPTQVIAGTPIPNGKIIAVFNPCVANNHLTLDTDGDGLSNFEEFLLGTNPIHWDTDGDTMNDGWEVLWGLDPHDPTDRGDNPDGDFMAYDGGENRHYDVYNVYGFDPRTAWIGDYLERDRHTLLPAPNTQAFSNIEEHYLGRWCIDHGLTESVMPMDVVYMTQPVPKGKRRYYDPAPHQNHVPDYAVAAAETHEIGEAGENADMPPYEMPYGSLSYLIDSIEITTDGCDTDGDSMPDGWELYVAAPAGFDAETGEPLPKEAANEKITYYIWPQPTYPTPHSEFDVDMDGLSNVQECHSTELCDYYESVCTNKAFASVNGNWFNKWWPCDPWNPDTDGDHLGDGEEGDDTFLYQEAFTQYPAYASGAFVSLNSQLATHLDPADEKYNKPRFGNNTMLRGHVPGGGLNPNAVDTDMDYLPDHWEYLHAGFNRDTDWQGGFVDQQGMQSYVARAGTLSLAGGGMDGTYFDSRNAVDECEPDISPEEAAATKTANRRFVEKDGHIFRNYDYDGDGLENYQEYWVNGMGHIQYDKWAYAYYTQNEGARPPYGTYNPNEFFVTVAQFAADGSDYPYYNFKAPGFVYLRQVPMYYEPMVLAWIPKHDFYTTFDWSAYADDWLNAPADGFNSDQFNRRHPTSDPFGLPAYPFAYMPSEVRPWPMGELTYASSDPRLADTDADNMDDYYEMFHGLNPVLSDVVDLVNQNSGMEPLYPLISGNPTAIPSDPMSYDFNEYPWLAGVPNADPDQDGIPNWEEALSPNQPAPANHNTDPSPLWFTDISNPDSYVNLFYGFGTAWNFWAPETFEDGDPYEYYPAVDSMNDIIGGFDPDSPEEAPLVLMAENRPSYIYSFEMNEGFDTDNDNLSDRYEIDGGAGGVTEPQNPDRPSIHKALYLDGASAARTRGIYAFGLNALRSWTIEAWVMPQEPASGRMQVILERPVTLDESDESPSHSSEWPLVRRTFRLGLDESGLPFVEFNSGNKNVVTEQAKAPEGGALEAGRWYHLAATMDGFQKKLALYIDGRRVASKTTTAIPYTGFTVSASDGIGTEYLAPQYAPIMIGASDSQADAYVDKYYVRQLSQGQVIVRRHNGMNVAVKTTSSLVRPERDTPQAALGNFFQGWVDEVRVWSGARPGGEDVGDPRVAYWHWPTIKDDYESLRRYSLNDVLEARNDTVKYMQRIIDNRKRDLERRQDALAAGFGSTNVTAHTPKFIDATGMTFEEYYAEAVRYLQMTGGKAGDQYSGEDVTNRVAPHLLCVYNFNSLPDPGPEGASPADFSDLNGRHEGYDGVPWLSGNANATTAYQDFDDPNTPYAFPQYVQNLVAALPLGHLAPAGSDAEYASLIPGNAEVFPLFKHRADHVADSKYWTRDARGGLLLSEMEEFGEDGADFENNFPNPANPYGNRYETSNYFDGQSHPQMQRQDTFDPVSAVLYNDLVPLLGARADMSVPLWDDPHGDNIGVNKDSDDDGLPDWWEYAHGMDPYKSDENGNGIRDDKDDFDGDGLSNWYEFLAGLDPRDATTNGLQADGDADTDGDGLSNLQEQDAGTHPLHPDSDDDGWIDGYEVAYGSNPLDSLDPYRPRALKVGVDGFAQAAAERYLVDKSFTLSASVNPSAYPASGFADIVTHTIKDGTFNYFIRLDPSGIVSAGFTKSDGSGEFAISAPAFRALPLNAWTSVSFTYDDSAHFATLSLNGESVASLPAVARPAINYSSHILPPMKIGDGFTGMIRNVLLEVPGENGPRMDIRFDDGSAYDIVAGVDTYGVPMGTDIGGQAEDFAIATASETYGSVAYRMLPETAATLFGDAAFVYLDENLVPVDEDFDTDGDGLPDQWEIAHGLNPYNPDSDGDGVTDDKDDPDLDGLNNYFEYLAGTDPNNAKTDGATFDGDADPDNDGLTNIQEQLYGSDPGLADTDDDGIADGDEVFGCAANGNHFSLPTSALSPARQGVFKATGTAAAFTNAGELAALRITKSWTLEAWVKGATSGVIVRRGVADGAINYELGLEGGKPYARIAGVYDGAVDPDLSVKAIADFAVDSSIWSHVAAVWSDDTRTLAVYVDGVLAANVYKREIDLGVFAHDGLAPVTVGDGLTGFLDEVRIWDIARSGISIASTAYRTFEYASAQPLVELRFDDFGTTAENFGSASLGAQAARLSKSAFGLVGATMVEDETSPIAADEFVDSDGDRIPDFWEIAIYGAVMACDPAGDEDGDGLSNLYEYYAHTFPLTKYTGDPAYGTGENASIISDANRDSDGDGLSNLAEQNLGTRPDLADTDDDGWTDYEEANGVTIDGTKIGVSDPLNSLSPVIPRAAKFDGTGHIVVPQRGGQSLASWTVAAWVKPDAANTDGTIAARVFAEGSANYAIGVETVNGELVPYAALTTERPDNVVDPIKAGADVAGTTFRDDNPAWLTLKPGKWTHIAATYTGTNYIASVTNGLLTLYIDGTAVAWRQDALTNPFAGAGNGTPLGGELRVGENFTGLIDDVRVVTHAVNADDIVSIMGGGPIAAPQAEASRAKAKEVSAKKSNAIAGDYIVRFRDGITKTASAATVQALGGNVRQTYNIINAAHVTVPQGADEEAFVANLRADPSVLYVEPNLKRQLSKAPNDTDYSKLWGLHNDGQTGGKAGCDIDAETAWEYTTGSKEIVVAVIDTGVDYNHPDLANNMWTNPGEIPGNGVDDDGNGFIDDVYGWDFINGDADPMDDHGHGSHCAGTIGGVGNNGQGVAGINWNVRIMALKAGSAQGGLTTASIIGSIDYSVQMGARLSSNSYGGYGYSQAEYDAVKAAGDAGMLFVAAAGNETNDNDSFPAYPASFDLDCVVAVAATDHKDDMAYFSNWGATTVDLGAPGVDIWSTAPTALVPSGYQNMSGTSMACPHVAGAAALIFAADPTLTATAVKGLLLEYADPVDALAGKCVSGGRLNVGAIIPVVFNPGGDLPVPASARGLCAHLRFDDGGANVHDFARGQDAFRVDAYAGRIEGGVTLVTDADEDLELIHFFADSDGDSLPDWWEEMVGFSPLSAVSGGRNGDDDGDGLSNFYEFRASLGAFRAGYRGLDPFNPDTDNDGISDYDEDSDGDGITNGEEQDVYLSDPGSADADDDGVADGDELGTGFDPTDSAAPYVSRALTFSGASGDANTVVVKDKVDGVFTERFSSREWTVEAWVNPAAASLSGEYPLVSRALFATGGLNYEIGLAGGKPYARFTAHDASTEAEVVAGGAIAASAWTHIAARFDADQASGSSGTLTLFVNGEPVAMKDVGIVPATGPGDLVFGSSGFNGQMFDVRVWKIPQTDASIRGMMQSELLGGKIEGMSGVLTVNGNGFLKEAATTLKANGDPIDVLEDTWTVEAWIKTVGNSGLVVARRNQSETTANDFNYAIQMNADGSLRGRFAIWFLYVVSREKDKDGNETVTYATMFDFTVNDLVGEMRVNDGEWHHVAYVRDATQCKLYVDGLLDASQGELRLPAGYEIVDYGIRAAPGPVVIGEGFTGSLEETRIWNRDLSTAEIGLYSHQNLSGSENGLVQYFTYDFETDDRYVTEHAIVRDNENEKGVFIRTVKEEAFIDKETIGPENFRNSPIRSLQNLSLSGAFFGRDGGETVEDRANPMAYGDFAGVKYVGILGSGVRFGNQNPLSWTETADSDGDELPDVWEVANGLDPYNSDQNGNGVPDGFDDFDKDGLRNEAEYRAGLDPWNPNTDGNSLMDFYDKPASSDTLKFSYGWLYTDMDYVSDSYELAWDDAFASAFRYDEHEDRDLDGWDNWSEALVGTALAYNSYNEPVVVEAGDDSADSNASIAESSVADKAANFPLPNLTVTLDYGGEAIAGSKLVVWAYSREDMSGWPDAVFVKDFSADTLDTWPMTVAVGRDDLVFGHLRQGRNWFYAWMDGAGSSGTSSGGASAGSETLPTWNDGEPAAIADNQLDGIDIGFDLNEVTFHLTDKAESFARFSWEGKMPDGDVHVALLHDGNGVFDRVIKWPRTWLHEGDIISWNNEQSGLTGTSRRNFGLGALEGTVSADDEVVRGFVAVLTPQYDFEADNWSTTPFCVISNWMHSASAVAKPVLYGPRSYEIVADARPEFRFSLDPEYTEFQFTLTRTNDNAKIFNYRVLAPGRFHNDATGNRDLVIWKFPHSIGEKISASGYTFGADTAYTWEVVGYSPALRTGAATQQSGAAYIKTASWSSSGDSGLNASGGKGRISVKVDYPSGTALNAGRRSGLPDPFIRVQAFRSKSFNGVPDVSLRRSEAGVCTLNGLEDGESYYIRAYVEQDDDQERDNWESWGYYRAGNGAVNLFEPVAVMATRLGNSSPYTVTIQDCDTDNDLLPDCYEYAKTGYAASPSMGVSGYAPSVRAIVAYASNPLAMAAATATSDYDSDGLNDYGELLKGTEPALDDTDGDGIKDGLEERLGFDSMTQQALKITSVAFDADGNPVLDWTWEEKAATKGPATTKRATLKGGADTMPEKVVYEIQAKVSLTDDEWTTIYRTAPTDEVDCEAVVSEDGATRGVDVSAFRFFRVKLGTE